MLEQRSETPAAVKRESIREAATHELKCCTAFFTEIAEGRKRHDLRRATDRDFHVGDRLVLREYDPARECYTGRVQTVVVTYVTSADLPCALSEEALNPDFCILSIARLADA
jgi:hypothetical protein